MPLKFYYFYKGILKTNKGIKINFDWIINDYFKVSDDFRQWNFLEYFFEKEVDIPNPINYL